MQNAGIELDYKDRRFLLNGFGLLFLLVGFTGAVFGPLEMYAFNLFAEGGRFHYPGFGFGSFMFGLIAVQIMGYYVIALICIPLGYGHWMLRRWIRRVMLTLLWSWLILGIPLLIAFLVMFISSKETSGLFDILVMPLMPVAYLVIPGLLIWFYRSESVRMTLEARDHNSNWIDQQPIPILVLSFLYFVYLLALLSLTFYNGIFPFFGVFLVNLAGYGLITFSVIWLGILIWGTIWRKVWAWWGALVTFGLLIISSIVSFSLYSWADLLSLMKFAETELDALSGMPLQGIHFIPIVGIPLLLTLVVILYSRRYFGVCSSNLTESQPSADSN
jgi:hypothetical protein